MQYVSSKLKISKLAQLEASYWYSLAHVLLERRHACANCHGTASFDMFVYRACINATEVLHYVLLISTFSYLDTHIVLRICITHLSKHMRYNVT